MSFEVSKAYLADDVGLSYRSNMSYAMPAPSDDNGEASESEQDPN